MHGGRRALCSGYEMGVELAAREAAQKFAGQPGIRIFRGIKVLVEQPFKTVEEFRNDFRAKKEAENVKNRAEGKPEVETEYEGVVTYRGDKVFTVSTDIDLMVAQEQASGKAKIRHLEEVKTGAGDTPGEAAKQVNKAQRRLDELAAGDPRIRLELADGTVVTDKFDAASAAEVTPQTRGPINGKVFSSTLEVTAEDLLKVAEEMLREKTDQAKKAAKKDSEGE
ncbi:MAG TPA: hypothetical protein VE093_24420 [Polyangiaceae bacterium]|nr:hypothetical protein [Polyangiaceae bacterium]